MTTMGVRVLSAATADLAVGAVWGMVVVVTDPTGGPVDTLPTFTVTLPDGSTATPTPESPATGVFRATLITTVTGRYVARVDAGGNGAADLVAYVAGIVTAVGMPALADVHAYLGETSWTDVEIQDALDAESNAQRRVCAVPAAYPPDLRPALLRRVWRNLVMRGQPFLTVPGAEDGTVSVAPTVDAEIRRFERPFRRLPVG